MKRYKKMNEDEFQVAGEETKTAQIQLQSIIDQAQDILNKLGQGQVLDADIQSKLALSEDYLQEIQKQLSFNTGNQDSYIDSEQTEPENTEILPSTPEEVANNDIDILSYGDDQSGEGFEDDSLDIVTDGPGEEDIIGLETDVDLDGDGEIEGSGEEGFDDLEDNDEYGEILNPIEMEDDNNITLDTDGDGIGDDEEMLDPEDDDFEGGGVSVSDAKAVLPGEEFGEDNKEKVDGFKRGGVKVNSVKPLREKYDPEVHEHKSDYWKVDLKDLAVSDLRGYVINNEQELERLTLRALKLLGYSGGLLDDLNIDLEEAKEIVRDYVDDQEEWIDPVGGTHYGNEDDPAAMYEEDFGDFQLKPEVHVLLQGSEEDVQAMMTLLNEYYDEVNFINGEPGPSIITIADDIATFEEVADVLYEFIQRGVVLSVDKIGDDEMFENSEIDHMRDVFDVSKELREMFWQLGLENAQSTGLGRTRFGDKNIEITTSASDSYNFVITRRGTVILKSIVEGDQTNKLNVKLGKIGSNEVFDNLKIIIGDETKEDKNFVPGKPERNLVRRGNNPYLNLNNY